MVDNKTLQLHHFIKSCPLLLSTPWFANRKLLDHMGWCDTEAFRSGEISIVQCPTVFSRGISWFGDWVREYHWLNSVISFSFTFGWIVTFDPIFVLFCPFQLSLQASSIFCFFLPENWHSSFDAPHPCWFTCEPCCCSIFLPVPFYHRQVI